MSCCHAQQKRRISLVITTILVVIDAITDIYACFETYHIIGDKINSNDRTFELFSSVAYIVAIGFSSVIASANINQTIYIYKSFGCDFSLILALVGFAPLIALWKTWDKIMDPKQHKKVKKIQWKEERNESIPGAMLQIVLLAIFQQLNQFNPAIMFSLFFSLISCGEAVFNYYYYLDETGNKKKPKLYYIFCALFIAAEVFVRVVNLLMFYLFVVFKFPYNEHVDEQVIVIPFYIVTGVIFFHTILNHVIVDTIYNKLDALQCCHWICLVPPWIFLLVFMLIMPSTLLLIRVFHESSFATSIVIANVVGVFACSMVCVTVFWQVSRDFDISSTPATMLFSCSLFMMVQFVGMIVSGLPCCYKRYQVEENMEIEVQQAKESNVQDIEQQIDSKAMEEVVNEKEENCI